MKKYFKDLLLNHDGSGSTKRFVGFLLLFISILLGIYGILIPTVSSVFELVFMSFLGASLTSFGFSSFDMNSYFKYMKQDPEFKPVNRNIFEEGV